MDILVLTDVIPAPILASKVRENDVLVRTAEIHESKHKDVHYTFVFVLHTSMLSHLKLSNNEHKSFLNLKQFEYAGRTIEIISVPSFKWNSRLWSAYVKLAYFMSRNKLRRIVKENNVDVIHAHNFLADLGIAYELSKDLNIPYLVTARKTGLMNSIEKHIVKFSAKAKCMISLGLYEKNLCAKMNPNCHLIPHGIDDRFLLQEKEYHSHKILKIVTVARLLFWKYIDQVILALDQIKEGFTYDIYGDGPYMDTLKALVEQTSIKDKVTFHGFLDYDAVPETLAKYDLFVLPSFRELFGRVYIEAMASGLPIIGAKTTGMDGYITEGEEGFLVDHTNVNELQWAINRFVTNEDLKIIMGRKAKELSKHFSWDAVITKLDTLYRDAVIQD
jgi:teichuronic acid biosynthesis glycosyltransferase TuaC